MTQKTNMIVPGFQAGMNLTAPSGNSYTSDANGIISAFVTDIQGLANAGCVLEPTRPVVNLSTGGNIVLGAVNVLPSTLASTVTYSYTLPQPLSSLGQLGQVTTLLKPFQSTAADTITCSGCQISTSTVVTFSSAGCMDIIAAGSTLFQILDRSVVASSLVTLTPATS